MFSFSLLAQKKNNGYNYIQSGYYQHIYKADLELLKNNHKKAYKHLKKAETSAPMLNLPMYYETYNYVMLLLEYKQYNKAFDPRRRLKDWLDTNAVYTNGTMRCLSITNFVDRTVSSHTAISACVINIRNVKIQDPFKLTIDAKEVNINAPFEMLGNAQLEIK